MCDNAIILEPVKSDDNNSQNFLKRKKRIPVQRSPWSIIDRKALAAAQEFHKCLWNIGKLQLTLSYIIEGASYRVLCHDYRISKSYVSVTIPLVCDAISKALHNSVRIPKYEEDWQNIADGFLKNGSFHTASEL
jgi:hypothetical protein